MIKFITSLVMFPILFPNTLVSPNASLEVLEPVHVEAFINNSLFSISELFGEVPEDIIAKQMDFVSSRKAFPASVKVIKKHEQTIRRIAREKGVPEDVALGVALLENGGSETAVSSAGALGVFQLMPGTARGLGLTVTKSVDERKNPLKNIEAGITYLKNNHELFGDWGLATWAYHAGEGNVGRALKLYGGKKAGKNPTVHQLLTNSSVKNFTKKLNDDSAGYPYKVLATAALYKTTSILPGLVLEV